MPYRDQLIKPTLKKETVHTTHHTGNRLRDHLQGELQYATGYAAGHQFGTWLKGGYNRLFHQPKGALNPQNKNVVNKKMATYTRNQRRRRKRKRGIIKKRIPRSIQPKTKVISMKASKYFQMSASSSPDVETVQGNSFDDVFGAGHTLQPLGYDQWKALYKSAYVLGVKVKLTAHNEAGNSMIVGLTPCGLDQGTSALSNYEHYRETPGTVSRLLSPDVDHCYITSQRSTKRFLSLKNIRDEDDLKIDLVNETPPTKLYWYHVWCQPTDMTTVSACEFVIDVEYIILLTDPIIPSRSVET